MDGGQHVQGRGVRVAEYGLGTPARFKTRNATLGRMRAESREFEEMREVRRRRQEGEGETWKARSGKQEVEGEK